MKIIDIIKQRGQTLFTVKKNTSALEAVRVMDTKKIGALIVLDETDNVCGIISERDVLYKCYHTDTKLKDQIVEKLMTPVDDILIGKIDDTAQDLINIMLYRRIRHIPIIENEKIIAMLTVEDILKMIMDSYENESRLLREHIKNPFGIQFYDNEENRNIPNSISREPTVEQQSVFLSEILPICMIFVPVFVNQQNISLCTKSKPIPFAIISSSN